ncbi:MAG: CBS domain-containing protein [Saprospiraceae bacterium]|nr:CBS domain-containing protein [Saprospiraceae bacterium]MCB0625263.1 CBS domain-containing protein [Saprospiraceae bacterium]MCB0680354.1 CBS domain-containing protein [Saprospiraceae bacterium]
MNVLAPISTIMTTNLITVNPKDPLTTVKEVFEKHKIHHIPVVRFKTIVGIVSKTDFLHFLRGFSKSDDDRFIDEARLKAYTVDEIMTTGMAKVESTDRINVALEVFKVNMFHAIPVVDNGELVGIVTTYDIIRALADEPTPSK